MTTIKEILKLDAKATAGPWDFSVYSNATNLPGWPAGIYARTEEERSIASIDGSLLICDFDDTDREVKRDQLADADLIATYRTAAPELARDLERLVRAADIHGDSDEDAYEVAKELRTKWGIK